MERDPAGSNAGWQAGESSEAGSDESSEPMAPRKVARPASLSAQIRLLPCCGFLFIHFFVSFCPGTAGVAHRGCWELAEGIKRYRNRRKKMPLAHNLHFEAGYSWHREQSLFVSKRLGFLLFLSGTRLCVTLLPLPAGDELIPTKERCWSGFFLLGVKLRFPQKMALLSHQRVPLLLLQRPQQRA